MHTIITMVDQRYFPYGGLLDTLCNVNHDNLRIYTPDPMFVYLNTPKDIGHNSIAAIDAEYWEVYGQSIKLMALSRTQGNATYLDWDTYINNDFTHVFDIIDGLCVTTTNSTKPWATVNGGVIFSKNGHELASDLFDLVRGLHSPESDTLLQHFYDNIWDHLDAHRNKKGGVYHRQDLSWWCDQVALCACNTVGMCSRLPCCEYNKLNAHPDDKDQDFFIGHMKQRSGAPSEWKDG